MLFLLAVEQIKSILTLCIITSMKRCFTGELLLRQIQVFILSLILLSRSFSHTLRQFIRTLFCSVQSSTRRQTPTESYLF